MNDISELMLCERLKCLSCTTRREILLLTNKSVLTIRDISESLNMEQITIKRHVKILMDCEFLSQNRTKNIISYVANYKNLLDTIRVLESKLNQ